MQNLTNRQVELIKELLATYEAYRKYYEYEFGKCEKKTIIFDCIAYKVLEDDYNNVCEIIDYIKGVKK